ncbi:hypothetical protein TNCV_4512831 [Trichonephila clavipes]|nr:hypothetical protein TNCV_4512831 [Trichonephila clavipes]
MDVLRRSGQCHAWPTTSNNDQYIMLEARRDRTANMKQILFLWQHNKDNQFKQSEIGFMRVVCIHPSKFSEKYFSSFAEEGSTRWFKHRISRSAVERSTTKLYQHGSGALLSKGSDTKMFCLEIYRTGQIIPVFGILRKIFYSLPRRREQPGLNRSPLDLQPNALPLSYIPASANFCFAFRRNGFENALSRNIQNGTNHSRLRNSQKNISLHFPEEGDTRV